MNHETKTWWKEAVFYQIYPRSFKDSNGDGIGDLVGVIEKLDHLKELGIGAVWLSPMYRSPMIDHGYDISDYEDIDPIFGTMSDFQSLLEGLHQRDIKLMIDLVINHTSDQHPWFVESRASRDNPKRDWYIWKDGKDGKEPNNWGSNFGGSAWSFDELTGQYYLHLFAKEQPDLNWRNPEVKEAIFAMVKRWVERGVDGFRVDVGHHYLKHPNYPDASRETDNPHSLYVYPGQLAAHQPGLLEIYQELRETVLGPETVLFGEMYDYSAKEALQYVRYDQPGFNMVYQFPIVHARGDWTKVKSSIREWYETFAEKGWNSTTFSNHDSARPVSVFGDDSNHHEHSAKLIAAFLLTAPGSPFLLQGEEIGMTNVRHPSIEDYQDAEMLGRFTERVGLGEDPEHVLGELIRWSRDNARTPVQWNDTEHAGFSSAQPWLKINPNYTTINIAAQTDDQNSVLNFYRTLIALRKQNPALIYGTYEPLTADDAELYAYTRKYEDSVALMLLNTSSNTRMVDQKLVDTLGQLFEELPAPHLTNYPDIMSCADDMRPWEMRLFIS